MATSIFPFATDTGSPYGARTRVVDKERLLVTDEDYTANTRDLPAGAHNPPELLQKLIEAHAILADYIGFDPAAHLSFGLDDCGEDTEDIELWGWRRADQTLEILRAIPAASFGIAGDPPLAALDVLPGIVPANIELAIRGVVSALFNIDTGNIGVRTVEKDMGAATVRVEYTSLPTVLRVLDTFAGGYRLPAI